MKPRPTHPRSDKPIIIFWLLVLVCILASLPFWLPRYIENSRRLDARDKESQAIIDSCTGSKETGTEILSYDTYYDNGKSAPPVCRLPSTAEEKSQMYKARAYRNGLEDGSISPDEPDAENCTGRICQ